MRKSTDHGYQFKNLIWTTLVLLALGIFSCGDVLPDYFSEYDATTNMIRSYQFGTTDSNGNTWTPDYWTAGGYATPTNQYMGFDNGPIGDVAGGGGQMPSQADDGTAAINGYRLEVVNQVNNGDFEAFAVSAGTETTAAALGMGAEWGENAAFTAGDVRIVNGGGYVAETISNNTLYINSSSNVIFHYITTNLTTWADATGPPPPDGQYVFHFDYISNTTDFYFQVNNNVVNPGDLYSFSKKLTMTAARLGVLHNYPTTSYSNEANNVFPADNTGTYIYYTYGNTGVVGSANNVSIDNLSIVMDTDYFVRIQIPKVPDVPGSDSALQLQPGGKYTFSVFIQEEAAADVTPTTQNRYPAQYVTLQAKPINGVIGQTHSQSIAVSATNWTEVSMVISADAGSTLISSNLDSYADTDNVIELSIMASPYLDTSISGGNPLRAGSILVALPRLYWEPED